MKKYDVSKGFTSLDTVTDALSGAWSKYSEAAITQLDAMRQLGALIFRLENVADLAKLGDRFLNADGIKLSGDKKAKAFAAYYREVIEIPDSSFISDARARGLAMYLMPEVENAWSREVFKRMAVIFRSDRSHDDMKKCVTNVLDEAGENPTGKAIADAIAKLGYGSKKAPKVTNTSTPSALVLENVGVLVKSLEKVNQITIAAMPDADRDTLREASDAFARILDGSDAIVAQMADTDTEENDTEEIAV